MQCVGVVVDLVEQMDLFTFLNDLYRPEGICTVIYFKCGVVHESTFHLITAESYCPLICRDCVPISGLHPSKCVSFVNKGSVASRDAPTFPETKLRSPQFLVAAPLSSWHQRVMCILPWFLTPFKLDRSCLRFRVCIWSVFGLSLNWTVQYCAALFHIRR